jgi:hypothetical protein
MMMSDEIGIGKAVQELIRAQATGDDRQIAQARRDLDHAFEQNVKRLIEENWSRVQSQVQF